VLVRLPLLKLLIKPKKLLKKFRKRNKFQEDKVETQLSPEIIDCYQSLLTPDWRYQKAFTTPSPTRAEVSVVFKRPGNFQLEFLSPLAVPRLESIKDCLKRRQVCVWEDLYHSWRLLDLKSPIDQQSTLMIGFARQLMGDHVMYWTDQVIVSSLLPVVA
jgi:hypothetical protein